MKYELIATATFGLEAVVKREVEALGYKVLRTEDGRVTYEGDERAVVRSNLWLRCADRVYLKAAEFDAVTFEELFQLVRGIAWERYLPVDASIVVVGTAVKSTLMSVPSCQSIIKKAIIERLAAFYVTNRFPETGAEYRVRFAVLRDRVTVMLDTSGAGLHKRGYRVATVEAPMKETLAAALVMLSYWREGAMRRETAADRVPRMLVDTCCGSGTILIEAALMARGVAPGLNRAFAAENWDFVPEQLWKEERKAAYDAIDYDAPLLIKGFDVSAKAVAAARANAEEAGVLDDISFSKMDMRKFRASEDYGVIVTNPPYGERIGRDETLQGIYQRLREILRERPTWSLFVITADKDLERVLGRRADRRRKLYNGRIETTYYQFFGEKPEQSGAPERTAK